MTVNRMRSESLSRIARAVQLFGKAGFLVRARVKTFIWTMPSSSLPESSGAKSDVVAHYSLMKFSAIPQLRSSVTNFFSLSHWTTDVGR
ncbi:hypothetical protein DDK22_38265 [Cupriavidus necator]|uniref:Uncharacterized protein n=1 Tax=Cupriavidus necator TaxID=106590 RepID=A0A367P7P5_CUPNE|nr:hypothetical protein DDK22_38265 [Cupriavidus necator]